MIAKANGEAIEAVETRLKGLGNPDVESLSRKAAALVTECKEQAYLAWSEYIIAAQGRLKFLLPYAEAADQGKKTMASMTSTGNASIDQLQGLSSNAIAVAGQYLNVTAVSRKFGYSHSATHIMIR